ncbi:MAG TPA: glycosyltransferase family 9 protein [Bacteroidales bacterium]|nr:glycosyltransferase family 9 protein [Bacteroidales bacterium]HPZ03199.1 glycosyltransferase family 9 protein [Bacteroidales bacterium]HQB74555.1 glycosyltransferase family 9 protein [Bacteroidales bacterium]
METPTNPTKEKYLIIRFSSIGDIVLTTPIVRSLRAAKPEAEIHFLVKKEYRSILESNPYITQIHTFQKGDQEVLKELKNLNFDCIIDLQKNNNSRRVSRFLGVPQYSFPKLNIRKWFLVYLKINSLPPLHIVDRYARAIAPLSVELDQKGLDFFIREEELQFCNTLPTPFRDRFVAIALGANHKTKQIPYHQLQHLCSLLHFPIILLGGKDVLGMGEQLAAQNPSQILNLCGCINLHQSAAVIQKSYCLVTPDTGLMHIGAALRTPMAVIWGNTIPELGMYPYNPGQDAIPVRNFEIAALSCRPCSKLGYKKCPLGHFRCMERINMEEVAYFINQI